MRRLREEVVCSRVQRGDESPACHSLVVGEDEGGKLIRMKSELEAAITYIDWAQPETLTTPTKAP